MLTHEQWEHVAPWSKHVWKKLSLLSEALVLRTQLNLVFIGITAYPTKRTKDSFHLSALTATLLCPAGLHCSLLLVGLGEGAGVLDLKQPE